MREGKGGQLTSTSGKQKRKAKTNLSLMFLQKDLLTTLTGKLNLLVNIVILPLIAA